MEDFFTLAIDQCLEKLQFVQTKKCWAETYDIRLDRASRAKLHLERHRHFQLCRAE